MTLREEITKQRTLVSEMQVRSPDVKMTCGRTGVVQSKEVKHKDTVGTQYEVRVKRRKITFWGLWLSF